MQDILIHGFGLYSKIFTPKVKIPKARAAACQWHGGRRRAVVTKVTGLADVLNRNGVVQTGNPRVDLGNRFEYSISRISRFFRRRPCHFGLLRRVDISGAASMTAQRAVHEHEST